MWCLANGANGEFLVIEGGNTMSDMLRAIDEKETAKAIEEKLREYRTYKLIAHEDKVPQITAKYTVEMPNFSNIKSSSTENVAIANVEGKKEAEEFFLKFAKAMNKLTFIERRLITLAFLADDPLFNYEICAELNISESKFYRLRTKALYKLALAMGVERYKEVG